MPIHEGKKGKLFSVPKKKKKKHLQLTLKEGQPSPVCKRRKEGLTNERTIEE